MNATELRFAPYKSTIVELKGGINENVSSLELKAGELIDCKNYMIAEGGYGGYQSVKGYERFDGIYTPSLYVSYVLTLIDSSVAVASGDTMSNGTGGTLIALGDGVIVSGTYEDGDAKVVIQARIGTGTIVPGEILTVSAVAVGEVLLKETLTGGTEDYHQGIEYARLAVLEVPGTGPILGLHIYNGKVYAFRKHTSTATVGFYVQHASTGWAEISTSGDPIVYSAGNHEFHFTNYNFLATSTGYSMFWCDGVNKARVYNGSTVSTITNAGMGAGDVPVNIIAHAFHLFLAYVGGSLQHSKIGDPTEWDGALGAGEFGLGDDITNLQVGVQNTLVITLREGLRVLAGTTIDDFNLQTFSAFSGARARSAQRLLGTIFFLDDRGITTMEAVQEYGDYGANSISQRFKQSLFKDNHTLNCTLVSRDMNQYRLFFNDRISIFVSFEGKEFRGATLVEYNKQISVCAAGENSSGTELLVFADNTTGYIYKMDSGTSFDGTSITCRLSTAFYHYGSPRQFKAFKRATLEVAADPGQSFDMKVDFDYNEVGGPRTIWYEPLVYGVTGGAIYGEGIWGIMKYGVGSAATNRLPIYISGIGTNMSYKIISNETYKGQHIIQNIISDYEIVGRRG